MHRQDRCRTEGSEGITHLKVVAPDPASLPLISGKGLGSQAP